MRLFLCLAAAGAWTALACPATLDAQTAASDTPSANAGDSAYGALRLVGKTLGRDALDRVVEVAGRDGSPQPGLWKITLAESAGGTREVDVAGGKIAAQRTEDRPPPSKATVHLADLNLDSSGAFDAADTQARKVHLRFDSVNYVLRTSDASGKPQWTLTLFNQSGGEVGAMRLGANDGNILSTDGRLANNTPASVVAATPRPAAVVTATVRPRPTATPAPRLVESHTTTTTTTVIEPSPPPPPAPLTDTVVVETTQPADEEGGLFTRTGRTLDKTSRKVEQTLRHTGTRMQRFFTGHIGDADQDAPPPPPPTRDPNYRGD